MTITDNSNKHINSTQNSRFKLWKKYLKNAADPTCPWIGVEGRKHVRELSGYKNPELLLLSSGLDTTEVGDIIERSRDTYFLPPSLFTSLSGVKNNQGIIAFYTKPIWTEKDLTEKIIVLDNLQDPGNLGTILRSASALGGFSIVTCGDTVSFFNQKVIRASAGYLFLVPFLSRYNPEKILQKGYQVWHSFPSGGTPLDKAEFQAPTAVVFGSEGQGLADRQDGSVINRLTIPMREGRDSLNVSVAASLVMYEINKRIT